MATKKQAKQAPSDADRVLKSIVKEQREQKRDEAERQKERKLQHSTPSPFTFDSLEDQTAHAVHTLRILERMCENEQGFEFTEEDFEAVAGLLFDTRLFLEPLDLRGVAGALATKKFTIAQAGKSGRPTIACAKCSQEKGASQ